MGRPRLTKLYLRDYRSYSELLFEPASGVNFLLGPNAAGKTNLLEAINYLSTLRSPRTSRDGDLVRWGSGSFYIKGQLETGGPGSARTLEVGYRSGRGRALRIDGVPVRRTREFLGSINTVFFSPDDLRLIKGGPEERRSFLDAEIGQVDGRYRSALDTYSRVLTQRNDVLKQMRGRRTSLASADLLLEPWDRQLVEAGSRIVAGRLQHLNPWLAFAAETYDELAGGSEELSGEYLSGFMPPYPLGSSPGRSDSVDREGIADAYAKAVAESRDEEMHRGYTLVGPHRDDCRFTISGHEARTYGSQGQQRSVALAIKIAEVRWMRDVTRREPILLLDDVISELDGDRARRLAALLDGGSQTMITSTDLDPAIAAHPSPTRWRVSGGEVIRDGTLAPG